MRKISILAGLVLMMAFLTCGPQTKATPLANGIYTICGKVYYSDGKTPYPDCFVKVGMYWPTDAPWTWDTQNARTDSNGIYIVSCTGPTDQVCHAMAQSVGAVICCEPVYTGITPKPYPVVLPNEFNNLPDIVTNVNKP